MVINVHTIYFLKFNLDQQGRIQDFRKGGWGGGGGLLINIHEAGGGGVWGGAPDANAFLLYHAHNTT